jgi:hypothetical protein
MEILDTSKWPKETDPRFEDKQVHELAKEYDVFVSVVQSMDSVNTLLVGIVTTFLVNFSHLQQLWIHLYLLWNVSSCSVP